MRAVFGLVLIAGIGLAGFAVYMAQGFFETQQRQLERQRAQAAKAVPTVQVYAVTREIEYGEKLTLEDVELIAYAEPHLPEGVFRTEEELFPQGQDVQRVVLRPMEPNEPVLAVKVTEPGEDAGITSRLSAGMRAFTIRVDVSSGVSGFLRPGDRVDVFWTGNTGVGGLEGSQRGNTGVTKLIQTNMRIIAVDQSADSSNISATVARTVTVEAAPAQVAALAQAQSTGDLSLALVGADDTTIAGAIEVNQSMLLGIQQQEVVQAQEERVCTIRTRRGAEVIEIPIPCTN